MNKDYDVVGAFQRIEEELINSMLRNYKRHRAWEKEEGFNWNMWQAEQLKSLQAYRKNNKSKFSTYFSTINDEVEEMIKKSYAAGNMDQEIKILKAIKRGYEPFSISEKVREFIQEYKGKPLKDIAGDIISRIKGEKVAEFNGEFFKINDRKLNALLKATKEDFSKAEIAMLRKANDEYRKTIFNAQVYANTGAGTMEQAVDMATKDFLSKGINCIEYKNGARVNIVDYVAMALRTANKRAYLQGEGAKRAEWGIHTVIVTKRGGGCPKCVPFQGKVFIDDVWSGGSSKDGNYPLLSAAMKAGLFHPNCKDTCTTFFPGINTEPNPPSKEEQKKSIEIYNLQQKQKYAERMVKKYSNLEKYSVDYENRERYKAKRKEWTQVKRELDYMSNRFIPEFGDKININLVNIKMEFKRVKNSKYNMLADIDATTKNKAVRLYEKKLRKIQYSLPKGFEMPDVAIINFEKVGLNPNAIAGYNRDTNIMFINNKYDTEKKIDKYLNKNKGYFASTNSDSHILHELGHKYHYDIIEKIAKTNRLEYNKAKEVFEEPISEYILNNSKLPNQVIEKEISIYAYEKYKGVNRMNEVMAEYFTIRNKDSEFIKFIGNHIREMMDK